MSKGSNRRPGTGYADNWEATFGKKAKSEQALQELTDLSQELGLYDLPDAQKPAPKLMTLSEAMKAGYSTEYVNCGPSVSGAVIRVAKWDDAINCLQYIDVRPDEPLAKTCQHCKHWLIFSGVRQCMNDDVVALLPESAIGLLSPADFGCNRFEGKV